MRRVCVFCGSSMGNRPEYAAAAEELGRLIAAEGLELVYGGGNVGLMGVIADAVLAAGGKVIGVIPEALMRWEVGHDALTELRVVASMHERKAMMAELADGFIAMAGGIGTLEELFEIWTWGQLGLHAKPLGFLDVAGYYGHLHAFLDHMANEGFVKPRHRDMVVVESDPGALLRRLRGYTPPATIQVIDNQTN
ncbi:TIGR00730 family Rossman fold protein [Paramagnetospirillum kuznetsovii]|uniref:Cytokinin riboside 5'-monophosphate phosphoribohydrolase n=1 Tax=Paramagnetospirillum kuznetsovii TaxID=2053833 RepID=A0A364NYQ8_9PROT|nr:TIGR00730 family Rossman fold protein [Paramagnetospirillum kuznetsovii]RAU22183.1 TIGR00730 family Rossman fold protein [Paramagnetospirillum kuznetsovii]